MCAVFRVSTSVLLTSILQGQTRQLPATSQGHEGIFQQGFLPTTKELDAFSSFSTFHLNQNSQPTGNSRA